MTSIDNCTTILSKSGDEHTSALPPVSLVLRTFVLLTLFVFSSAKKFVFFCDRGIIPIRFCSSPGRPFRKILVRMRFFHSRNISTDSARDLIICRTVDKCKGSIHLCIIPLTLFLSLSFLFPALPLRLFPGQACLLHLLCFTIDGEHHISQTVFQDIGSAIPKCFCAVDT